MATQASWSATKPPAPRRKAASKHWPAVDGPASESTRFGSAFISRTQSLKGRASPGRPTAMVDGPRVAGERRLPPHEVVVDVGALVQEADADSVAVQLHEPAPVD
eukprot:2845370-Alexandrium_andersonii.AAC.1